MSKELECLLRIVKQLRDPQHGCPWDLEQNYQTMIPHIIEECYEVIETIEQNDLVSLKEELGDLLLQVVFLSQLASEEDHFSFDEVVRNLNNKLISRHPHVFGDKRAQDSQQALHNWEAQKQQERLDKAQFSAFDDIPHALPALLRAIKLQKRAQKLPHTSSINAEDTVSTINILTRELSEKKDEATLGKLLFQTVELCRLQGINPEIALRNTNQQFEQQMRLKEKQNSK